MRSDPVASAANPTSGQPLPTPAPSSPAPLSPAPASETGSTVDRANDPAPIRIARTISDVNVRAGPSNRQAVLATIPRGSPVDVINCRQWCEVVFAGRRGWVYKGFIGASPTARGR
jgi:SH3-like domain-containing protein